MNTKPGRTINQLYLVGMSNNLFNLKWTRRSFELLDEWREDHYKKTHMPKEQSLEVEPDVDEVMLFGYEPIPFYEASRENKVYTTLETKDYVKQKRGRKEKIRLPIPKKLRIEIVRERGGICQRCSNEVYHHMHHIDGDPGNNEKTNLLLVCIDCHHQIESAIRKKKKE